MLLLTVKRDSQAGKTFSSNFVKSCGADNPPRLAEGVSALSPSVTVHTTSRVAIIKKFLFPVPRGEEQI